VIRPRILAQPPRLDVGLGYLQDALDLLDDRHHLADRRHVAPAEDHQALVAKARQRGDELEDADVVVPRRRKVTTLQDAPRADRVLEVDPHVLNLGDRRQQLAGGGGAHLAGRRGLKLLQAGDEVSALLGVEATDRDAALGQPRAGLRDASDAAAALEDEERVVGAEAQLVEALHRREEDADCELVGRVGLARPPARNAGLVACVPRSQ
jgi:hypothetical protein